MKQIVRGLLSIALLGAASTALANNNNNSSSFGHTYFNHRSQGLNLARRLVLEAPYLYPCLPCFNGVVSATFEYTQNFRNKKLGTYFSFNDTNEMRFAGSGVTGDSRDVLADYFFLPATFDGTSAFKPRVQNFIADIEARFNLNCKWYVDVSIPVNWTKWDMRLTSTGTATTTPSSLYTNINQAWAGASADKTITVGSTPVKVDQNLFATLDGAQKKTRVADLQVALGYLFLCNECHHFGINLRVAAPTGNKSKAKFMFEPISGNNGHWQFGGGLNGHVTLWNNGCDSSLTLWAEGAAYHLFKSKQKRTYDFTDNGIGSRYLILKKFNNNVFANEVTTAANVTTLDSKVSVGVVGELALMFEYKLCNWVFDLGYDAWGRSKEKVSFDEEIAANTWGISGVLTADNNVAPTARINGDNRATYVAAATSTLISNANLNESSGAAPSAFSNKVFGNVGYTWECCNYAPFFGVGGEAEFSSKKNNALSQWGVWLKGGLAYQ